MCLPSDYFDNLALFFSLSPSYRCVDINVAYFHINVSALQTHDNFEIDDGELPDFLCGIMATKSPKKMCTRIQSKLNVTRKMCNSISRACIRFHDRISPTRIHQNIIIARLWFGNFSSFWLWSQSSVNRCRHWNSSLSSSSSFDQISMLLSDGINYRFFVSFLSFNQLKITK